MAQDTHELNESPLLKQLRGSDPFVVPESFFERFPHQVQAAATRQGRSVTSRWSGHWHFWPAGVAVALMAALFLWPRSGREVQGPNLAQTAIDPSELDLYALEQTTDLLIEEDAPTLAEVYLPVTDDELLGYIAHEEIALDLLIEEL